MNTYIKLLLKISTVILPLGFLAACASQAVLIGEKATEPAPQVVFLGARDGSGKDYLTWENVSSFGRVPSELQAVGDLSCMRVDPTLRATGYHPRARDRHGKVMPGGGYFCQIDLTSRLDAAPPRLVMNGSQLGWDRPGVFRPVPSALVERAQRECARQGANMKAIGFHPGALDVNGRAVPEGGFLCVE